MLLTPQFAVQIDPELVINSDTLDRCARSCECRVFTNLNTQDLGLDELLNDWAEQNSQLVSKGGTACKRTKTKAKRETAIPQDSLAAFGRDAGRRSLC
jgi:hypothetical protein